MGTALAGNEVGTQRLQFEPPAPAPGRAPPGALELLWTLKRNPLECWSQEHIGRIGLLDLLGAPDFIPRISHVKVRSTLKFFESAVDESSPSARAMHQGSGTAETFCRSCSTRSILKPIRA
jgi:hypothetical protein